MTEEKLISVVIPVYNAEKYLKECIESFLRQTYKNLEIIMVDDGSTDASAEIIEDASKKDKRIQYIYQKNSGAPAARNNGLDHAKGEYIYLFDADDLVEDDTIQLLFSLAEEQDADIAIGNFRTMLSADKTVDSGEFDSVKVYCGDEISECMLLSPLPGNKLFRSRMIKEKEIRFAQVRLGQDLNFYQKVLSVSKKVCVCPEYTMRYRIVGNSVSHSYTGKVVDIIKSLDDVRQFHENNGVSDKIKGNLDAVRVKHYAAETSKVPKIKEKKVRKEVMAQFSTAFDGLKVPKSERKGFVAKKYFLLRLRVVFSFIYCTETYCFLREHLKRIVKRG
ncbi:MAG: glycosyltransferase family 2 protein [Lachnospiraceae bacterium]|nr:glycosyltransferase family 2 protein [Lachnospiraceae bacterium]